jgi:hypothetical protein
MGKMVLAGTILIVVCVIFLLIGSLLMPSHNRMVFELENMTKAIVWLGLGVGCGHVGLFLVFFGPIHKKIDRIEKRLQHPDND